MTIEDVYDYRDRFYSWVARIFKSLIRYIRSACAWVVRQHHSLEVRKRAWFIKQRSDLTMGDKLRILAAKIDAIEEYKDKYCNPDKVCRVDTYRPIRNYRKMKNNLKKELLVLLHGY